MRVCFVLVVSVGAFGVCAPVAAQDQLALPQRRGVSWDAQLEGGVGVALRNELPHAWFGRARAGMLIMHEPLILAFGPTVELGGLIGVGVGGQLDLIHLPTGVSIETGVTFAETDDFASHLSVGYAIFGLEWQHRFALEAADALMFRVRVPVGVAVYLWTHR